MLIAEPTAAEEDITRLNETLTGIIEKEGGTIVKLENMGRRKLAYEIKRRKEGHYVLFEIEGSGKEIAELERRMRVNELIFRYLTVRVDEERKTADKIQAKRTAKQTRRAGGNFPTDGAAENQAAEARDNQ